MIWLLALLFTSVLFNQTLRYGQLNNASTLHVVAVNYLAAAVFSVGRVFLTDCDAPNLVTGGLGALNGIFYFTHLLIVVATFRIVGVGIAMALISCGSVIPVLMSWCLWPQEEVMTVARWVAVALVPISLFLMRPKDTSARRKLTPRDDLLLVASFLMAGAVQMSHVLAARYGGDGGHASYQAVLFVVATAGSFLCARMGKPSIRRQDIVVGSAAGLFNGLNAMFVLLGLSALGAVMVYPILGASNVGLNLLAANLLWREWIDLRQALGLVLAIVIVCLTTIPA